MGITAGCVLLPELKDPGLSYAFGTVYANMFTTFVYVLLGFVLACTTPREILKSDNAVFAIITIWKPLTYVGIFVASLSSALYCLMNAPRTICGIANDNIFPYTRFLAKRSTRWNVPVNGFLVTCVIALTIVVNRYNQIAPFVTVFSVFALSV
jgi:amino acid transporter